jgi:hypothetical protein
MQPIKCLQLHIYSCMHELQSEQHRHPRSDRRHKNWSIDSSCKPWMSCLAKPRECSVFHSICAVLSKAYRLKRQCRRLRSQDAQAGPACWPGACMLLQRSRWIIQNVCQQLNQQLRPHQAACDSTGIVKRKQHGSAGPGASTEQQQGFEQQGVSQEHLRGPQRAGRCSQSGSGGVHPGWALASAQVWRHVHGLIPTA